MQVDLNRYIDEHREDIIRAVQEIVRIPSVEAEALPGKPFGEKVDEALRYSLDLAERLGFKVKNVDGYAGHAEFGEGGETMGILCHLDVVPEGSNWSFPPYEARIVDGKIYGRGASDDKGPTIGALYAMKAVMESGRKMKRKVRIIWHRRGERLEGYGGLFSERSMPDFGVAPMPTTPLSMWKRES